MAEGRPSTATAVLVAVVAALPFLHGLALGHSFYFRDLALHFIPLRLFALDGLRAGELRYWNPYLHAGIPNPFPPISYPLDLLQLARPDVAGVSLVLALHVPLAALAFLVLSRSRGVPLLGSAAGALAYALGGFALSTLNLYLYLQAVAWAPLVVWALGRAAQGGARQVALAGAIVAVAASTLGVEVVGQAVVCGAVLASRRERRALSRLAAAVTLGLALAAPVLFPLAALAGASQRGQGFPTDVVLAHSIHPLTWVQVLVAGWHGDPLDLVNRWWGSNFFPRGFPYVVSLYVGATVLALAFVGAGRATPGRTRLLALAAAAAFLCLGRYAGLGAVVEVSPHLRAFRYPVKMFFTIHLVVAVLAAHGLGALQQQQQQQAAGAWRRLWPVALGGGALLCGLGLLPLAAPALTGWLLSGLTPPEYTSAMRDDVLRRVLVDAARGGIFAVALGGLGLLVVRGSLGAARAALAAVALLAADLLRAGAGLNPMVEASFFRVSPVLEAALPALRSGGRIFTCPPHESPAYLDARSRRPHGHELWTFATHMETLTPASNVPLAVRTARSEDVTSLLPPALVPRAGEGCADVVHLEGRLREAGVSWILSLDALAAPGLDLRARWQPARLFPLVVHAYALRDPRPRTALRAALDGEPMDAGHVLSLADAAGRLEMVVESARPALVVVREGYFPGWRAEVNGASAPVVRAEQIYRAVPVGTGRSQVVMRYHAPGLRAGLATGALAVVAAAWLCRPRTRRASG